MAKLERLLKLTAELLETERPLTADELRMRIDGYPESTASFRRAFERDKDDLREMGVPIAVEPVPGSNPPIDGYRIHKHEYYLDDPGLEPDELAALHLAASAVSVEGLPGAEAIRKLGGATASQSDELLSLPTDPRLATLFQAVSERRLVTFEYRGSERELEPARIDMQRGRWYVSGHDRTRGGDRHFRLDRLEGEITLGPPGAYVRDAPAEGARLDPWELGDSEPRTAHVQIDAAHAAWAVPHLGLPVTEQDDGSVVVEFPVTNEDAFRSTVLNFLDHAQILDPPDLRADVIAWLQSIAEARR
jgi:proteasome accessory factor B